MRNNLRKEIASINSINASLKKLLKKHKPYEIPEIEKELETFDKFYSIYVKLGHIILLPISDVDIQSITDRAINRKKPFTETKTELKDAIIWETYSKYVNSNQLNNCFFITSNIKDFCDLNDKKEFVIHPDLKKECDRFTIFLSIEDFYKANTAYLDDPIIEFKNWLSLEEIDSSKVFAMLWKSKTQNVFDAINKEFENRDPSSIDSNNNYMLLGGYVDIEEVSWHDCKDIEIDIVKDYAIISGILETSVELELYSYNSMRDPGEDKFPFAGTNSIDIEVYFNFVYSKKEEVEHFEITDLIEK